MTTGGAASHIVAGGTGGGEGGGAPGGQPGGAPAGGTPGAGGGQGGGAPQLPTWVGQNQEYQTYAQQKGWDSPEKAVASYRELEKLLGGEKLPLPKDPADKEGWDRVYKALGRPDSPDGYGIQVAQGGDAEFAKRAAGKFHELGLPANMAKGLSEWYESEAKAAHEAEETAFVQKAEAEFTQVKQNWGANYDQNMEITGRAAKALGLGEQQLDALERSLGTKAMYDLLFAHGQAISEAGFRQGEGGGGPGKGFTPATVEQAQARKDEILNNPDLRKQALTPGTEMEKEISRLSRIIAGARA